MLFNLIAPVYGLFYQHQRRRYKRIVEQPLTELGLLSEERIIDIGCGTGALCSVFDDLGFEVTGIDPAGKMLEIARKKSSDRISFKQVDILEGLPYGDKSFDVAIASYVAHGLTSQDRRRMYLEMARVARDLVIIHDYNQKRSLMTTIIEWMERGDYFHFIRHADQEMRDCISDMKACFADVRIIEVDVRAAWYVCKPSD